MVAHFNYRSTLEALGSGDVLKAIAWAEKAATRSAYEQYDEALGHDNGWFGATRHNQFCDRLDRIFSTKAYAIDPQTGASAGRDIVLAGLSKEEQSSLLSIKPGLVTRDDLKQSPGWRYKNFRLLIQSAPVDKFEVFSWKRKGGVKLEIAEQPYFAEEVSRPQQQSLFSLTHNSNTVQESEIETLVVMHGFEILTQDRKLAIGRPRLAEGDYNSWHWLEYITEDPSVFRNDWLDLPKTTQSDTPDAPVRLRKRVSKEEKK